MCTNYSVKEDLKKTDSLNKISKSNDNLRLPEFYGAQQLEEVSLEVYKEKKELALKQQLKNIQVHFKTRDGNHQFPVYLPDLALSCHLMPGWKFETMQKVAVSSIPGCGEADGTLQDGATGPPPHYRDVTVVVA